MNSAKTAVIAIALLLIMASTAHASGTIRLGRDVAPAAQHPMYQRTPAYRYSTPQHAVERPVVIAPQPASHAPTRYRVPTQRQQPSAVQRSSSRITNSAINTTTHEISRGVNTAIRNSIRRINF